MSPNWKQSWKQSHVGVLMGGVSSEREVSLQTGAGVINALSQLGYRCTGIDWTEDCDLPSVLAQHQIDVVWNALHGTYGEDGAVQGMLTCLNIPFTGSGVLASAVAMDKVMSKRLFDAHDIATPPWEVLQSAEQLSTWTYPLVIKPAQEGSSVGVSIVQNADKLPSALALAKTCHGATLVEQYIEGAELCVGILAGSVLGSIEVRPALQFYDYSAKYDRNDTEYVIPPTLAGDVVSAAEALALRSHKAVGCGSYSRVDLRISDAGQPFVLEVNTLPGMTDHSLLPKIAEHAGIDYAALCEQILDCPALL